MNRSMRFPLLLSGICVTLCLALPAAPAPVPAPGVSTVTCPANEDRVWLYDSLTSLDVEAKLHCGDTVQIVSRVKGYVKVRIASGVVGYLPDSVFPDLPPLTDDQEKLGDHNAAPTVETTQNDSSNLAAVAAAYRARDRAPAATSARAVASVPSAAPEAAPTAAPKPSPSVVAMTAQPATPEIAATVAPVAPRASSPANISARKGVAVVEPPAAPEPVSTPRRSVSVAAAVEAKPVVPMVAATPAPAPPPAAPEVAATTAVATATPHPMDPPIPAPAAMPAVAATADASLRGIAATKPIGTDPESEDYPDTQPQDASADPNCRIYFSAYGLGAQQYKWLSEARQKQFAGICPAPNLKSVDFVILFTHDSDSYISAMPTPVHTDPNGFSDFDPLTTVDTALMSPTEADKAHYELAWVFHVRRGAFDPNQFSPRRRPQYESTAKGLRASTKAVEDAFNFIQRQAPTR